MGQLPGCIQDTIVNITVFKIDEEVAKHVYLVVQLKFLDPL